MSRSLPFWAAAFDAWALGKSGQLLPSRHRVIPSRVRTTCAHRPFPSIAAVLLPLLVVLPLLPSLPLFFSSSSPLLPSSSIITIPSSQAQFTSSLPPHTHTVGKMAANKSSAVSDEPIDVLIALHHKFDLLDLAGPVEALTTALHDFKDECE